MLSKQNPFVKIAAITAACVILLCASGCSEDNNTTNEAAPSSSSSAEGYSENSYQSSSTNESKTDSTQQSSTTASTKTTTTTKTKKTTTTKATENEYLYAYAGFNPAPADMSAPITKILLNRDYVLPDGYEPKLAVAVKGTSVKLDYRVAPHYQEMYDAALKDGITLTPVSGYRTYTRQKNNFERRIALLQSQGYSKVDATIKASEVILLPGTSEHNAGLAMDICSLSESFENTKEFRWLQDHAHEYGFIMRYPKDKTNVTKITYEPWHYRYVGVEIAKELKSSGMVLEEYLGKA